MWVEDRLNENLSRIGIQENFKKKAVFTSCETALFFVSNLLQNFCILILTRLILSPGSTTFTNHNKNQYVMMNKSINLLAGTIIKIIFTM